jgi:hypothetical protein
MARACCTSKPTCRKPSRWGSSSRYWGQTLSATAAAGLSGKPAYYVVENEKITRVTTDPAAIVLGAHKEIVIVTGTPPAQIPRYNWNTSGL